MSDPKPSVREQYDQAMARGEGNVFLTRLEQADREREYAYLAKAQAEHSERIARVEKSAKSLMVKIGGVGAGLLVRALIGG